MNIGDQVTLKFKNNSAALTGPLKHLTPEFEHVTGTIISVPHWVKDSDCIAVHVAHSPVQVRIINKHDIIFDGTGEAPTPACKVFKIAGSKGGEYTVTNAGSAWTCSCVGFQFRKHCKHVEDAKKK